MDYPQSGRQTSVRWRADVAESEWENRPTSRRGLYDRPAQISASIQSNHRRKSAMRPGSAYRGGTASRLTSNSFGAPPPTAAVLRMGTGSRNTINMMDRPITQQGLSGLRTGTSTGVSRTRQLRDKRYWEEELGGRIRALAAEVERLHKAADTAAREKSANKHYEARGKELARELTDLQGRLTDYNLTAQMLTAADITAIQRQTSELEASNRQISEELEMVFAERQRKEGQLRQITDQMKKEQSTVDELINEMTPVEKNQYLQLRDVASSLLDEVEQTRSQLEEISKSKNDLEKQISISQMKIHMVDLIRKLMLAEEKKNELKEEMSNKLQPAQEREQLLAQVREDNAAISTMESNAQSVKEEIKRAQDLLEQAEQDLEEGQSERHQKYRELKKREETMELFMSSFEQNMLDEKAKIGQLESDIVFALEHTSSNLDQLNFDEIDSLKQRDGGYSSMSGTDGESNKSAESLAKEYGRLEAQLKKTQDTRERLAAEVSALPEKIAALHQSIDQFSDLDTLRTNGAAKRRQLKEETIALKEKLAPTESAVQEASKRYRELQKQLDGNEMYSQLNAMEEKLATLENNNTALREDIASITIKTDYEPIKKQVFDVLESINEKLKISHSNIF